VLRESVEERRRRRRQVTRKLFFFFCASHDPNKHPFFSQQIVSTHHFFTLLPFYALACILLTITIIPYNVSSTPALRLLLPRHSTALMDTAKRVSDYPCPLCGGTVSVCWINMTERFIMCKNLDVSQLHLDSRRSHAFAVESG